jgi:hypothetical protein
MGDDVGFLNTKKKRNKVGRIAKVTKEKYLDAVKKGITMSDSKVGVRLGVNRSSVFRFRVNPENADVVEMAEYYLRNLEIDKITINQTTDFKTFYNIPSVRDFERAFDITNDKPVTDSWKRQMIRGLFNLCKYMNIHPDDLEINFDFVCETIVEMKLRKQRMEKLSKEEIKRLSKEQKIPNGMSYCVTRHVVRAWYQKMCGISGEIIKAKGVGAENIGLGRYNGQRVTYDVRIKFEDSLKDVCESFKHPEYYDEIRGICIWMYNTATRVDSSQKLRLKGRQEVNLNDEFWMIQIVDKGDLTWKKYLLGDKHGEGLKMFREYVSKRFNIPIDEYFEKNVIEKVDYLFPTIKKLYNLNDYVRKALKKAGLPYNEGEFRPNHIWRNTFAQEFLMATDYNYELTGIIGGWENTDVLKRSYGEMPEESKLSGLSKAMGKPVKKLKYRLNWYKPIEYNDTQQIR